jgi:hypothetical protein
MHDKFFIGKDKTWVVVNKHDTKNLIPLLVMAFKSLKPSCANAPQKNC